MAGRTDADDLLRWMTDHGRFAVDRWLRTESLQQDVLSLLDELGALTPGVRERVLAVGRVNEGSYQPSELGAQQIRRMYQRNPVWAEIERDVYGELAA